MGNICPRLQTTTCEPGPILVQVRTNGARTRRTTWHDGRTTGPRCRCTSASPAARWPTTASTWPPGRSRHGCPRGDGHPVLVLPGLLADDISTRALRARLRRLDYDAHGWGLGRNIGPTAACVNGMRDKLDYLHDRHGRPVTLIGWSLGGIFARDLARPSPDARPPGHHPGQPVPARRHDQTRPPGSSTATRTCTWSTAPCRWSPRASPLPVPATSIYSHFDGIVHWQTCLDTPGERCENIAVMASHLGLGHHPAVDLGDRRPAGPAGGHLEAVQGAPFLRPAFPKPAQASPCEPVGAVAGSAA